MASIYQTVCGREMLLDFIRKLPLYRGLLLVLAIIAIGFASSSHYTLTNGNAAQYYKTFTCPTYEGNTVSDAKYYIAFFTSGARLAVANQSTSFCDNDSCADDVFNPKKDNYGGNANDFDHLDCGREGNTADLKSDCENTESLIHASYGFTIGVGLLISVYLMYKFAKEEPKWWFWLVELGLVVLSTVALVLVWILPTHVEDYAKFAWQESAMYTTVVNTYYQSANVPSSLQLAGLGMCTTSETEYVGFDSESFCAAVVTVFWVALVGRKYQRPGEDNQVYSFVSFQRLI